MPSSIQWSAVLFLQVVLSSGCGSDSGGLFSAGTPSAATGGAAADQDSGGSRGGREGHGDAGVEREAAVGDGGFSTPDAESGGDAGRGGASDLGGATGAGGAGDAGAETGGAGGDESAGGKGASGGDDGSGGALGAGGKTGAGGCATGKTFYPDADGDHYGVTDGAVTACAAPNAGQWSTESGDCDDDDASVHPKQTTYFGEPYTTPAGDSFDYDCSGAEDPDPALPGAAPACGGLSALGCSGSGYAATNRSGAGKNALCGSKSVTTCTPSALTCAASTTATQDGYRCR